MRILRFNDDAGDIRYGQDLQDGHATLLQGDPFLGVFSTGVRVPVCKILAPIHPVAIFGIGLNYRKHAEETGQEIPRYPVVFMKNPASLNHPGDPIHLPACSLKGPETDWEVELAVVIGRTTKDIDVSHALECVAGYTVGNDVSARRWQKHAGGGQWVRGKSFDTFCPLGPVLVTPDEIPDPQNLPLRLVLNGEVMQSSNTADMIFPVAELIAELSRDTTLLAGTVILTGTPSGVGFARNPPQFLQAGDVVEAIIDGIGTLRNPVV